MKTLLLVVLLVGCGSYQVENVVETESALTATYNLGTRLHHTDTMPTIKAAELYMETPRLPNGPSQQSAFTQGYLIGNFSFNQQNAVEFKMVRAPGHFQRVGSLTIWVPGDHYNCYIIATTGPAGTSTATSTTITLDAYTGDNVGMIYNAAPEWLGGNPSYISISNDRASGHTGSAGVSLNWQVTPGTNPLNVVYDPYAVFTVNTDPAFGCLHDMPRADDDVTHDGTYEMQAWYWQGGSAPLVSMPFGTPLSSGCGLQAFQSGTGYDVVQWHTF